MSSASLITADGEPSPAYFEAVGRFIVMFAQAEQVTDMLCSIAFRAFPHSTTEKELPRALKRKVTLLRQASRSETVLKFYQSRINGYMDELNRLSRIRHDLAHGAIASFDADKVKIGIIEIGKKIHRLYNVTYDLQKLSHERECLQILTCNVINLTQDILQDHVIGKIDPIPIDQ